MQHPLEHLERLIRFAPLDQHLRPPQLEVGLALSLVVFAVVALALVALGALALWMLLTGRLTQVYTP